MSSTTFPRAALALLMGTSACATWALPSQYHLTDLGPDSYAVHINASGVASGTDSRFSVNAPALWVDGAVTDLASLDGWGSAEWVNASNVASGYVETDSGFHAAVWSSTGVLTDIGAVVGGDFNTANAINDNGDCTIDDLYDGKAYLSPGCTGSGLVDLGSLGKGNTSAIAINANGQVAGASNAKGGQRAYLYTNGQMKNLGVLTGYVRSDARGLNGKGHVVGRCADADDKSIGYYWNGTKMLSVGTLGGKHSFAYGINYFDVIVGSAQNKQEIWRPFILDKGTKGSKMIDLTTMIDSSGAGWSLVSALGINNAGQIIVQGVVAGDNALRTAILTPLD